MAKIQLEVVTPAKRVLSQQVDAVQAPGANGSFGVLPGHTAFVSRMKAGQLVAESDGQKQLFCVGEGFVQVVADKVLVLAESCERSDEIDPVGARAEHETAAKKLAAMKTDDANYELQRAAVERAAARVLVAGR